MSVPEQKTGVREKISDHGASRSEGSGD